MGDVFLPLGPTIPPAGPATPDPTIPVSPLAMPSVVRTNTTYASPSEYESKYVTIIDSNLYSGSSDVLRNAIGGYFHNKKDPEGRMLNPPAFVNMKSIENMNENIYIVDSYSGLSVNVGIASLFDPSVGDLGTGVGTTDDLGSDAEFFDDDLRGWYAQLQDTILPYTTFICQIEGDATKGHLQDTIIGNQYWKSLFTGEDFNNQPVTPIYSNAVFDQHYTHITLPYEKINQKTFSYGPRLKKVLEISYDYLIYDQMYQNSITNLRSEKLAPNWYVINMMVDYQDAGFSDATIENYYDKFYMPSLVDPETDSMGPLLSVVENMTNKNDIILNPIEKTQANILFNSNGAKDFLRNDTAASVNSFLLPYYIKIQFDTEISSLYAQFIKESNFSTNFLKNLKEVFLEQTDNQLNLDSTQFVVNTSALEIAPGETKEMPSTTSTETAYRTVDYLEFLFYCHNNIKEQHGDFFVVDNTNVFTKTAKDDKGVYRSITCRDSLRVINRTLDTFTTNINAFSVSDISTIMNVQNESPYSDEGVLEEQSYTSAKASYNEVLAYRVEKIGGPATGDSNTQNVIQNFWIFNDSELFDLNLYDLQVKYGAEYTYKIYAYYLIKGLKYETSNLQLTRIVGNVRADSSTSSDTDADTGTDSTGITSDSPITGYCVEYYDPTTGLPVKDMLAAVPSEESDVITSTAHADTVRIRVSSQNSETDVPLPPYIANFVVSAQPSLKIVEIPIDSKAITIHDYLPNKVNVEPNFALDNSNKLIFNIMYQSFDETTLPALVNSSNAIFRNKFLVSNDLTADMIIDKKTVSPARYLDIYRLAKKPTSYEDFAGNLYKTIDNRVETENFAYKNFYFVDIVKSNTKYYYLFKTRNDLNVAGHHSEIFEAELINDGGYKYAQFNSVPPEDLIVENYKTVSETVKKILQVVPNFKQIELNDSAVDYTQTALEQYGNLTIGSSDTSIWNKTFKLRLTSKKTGKKIDLNITYNDPNTKNEQ